MSDEGPERGNVRVLWLVDAYNVLRVSLSPRAAANGATPAAEDDPDPARWWTAERRLALLEAVTGLREPAHEICLVFDARQLDEALEIEASDDAWPAPGHVRSFYAPSADDWIVATLRARADDFDRRLVVTADRRLANRARSRGAEIVSTQDFVGLCGVDRGGSPD